MTESTPHRTSLRVRFYELDPYAHVNHATYIQYFETARIELLDDAGFGLDVLADRQVQLVVIGLRTRFLGAAGLGDTLTIESGVLDQGRVRSTWAQRILRGNDTLVTQIVQFAATDERGRVARTPHDLLDGMARHAVPEGWLGKQGPL